MDPRLVKRMIRLRRMALLLAVLLYLALTLAQLSLPGLHYDEAKEAGLNAMEMLQRQDVHAFRSAGLQIGPVFLPLMVQDYIGALNVYLALPLLALFRRDRAGTAAGGRAVRDRNHRHGLGAGE